MTQEQILEGNKLIAAFMGYQFDKKPYRITKPKDRDCTYAAWELEDFETEMQRRFQYHTSWDCLMPVVEKIEELNYGVELHLTTCRIYEISDDMSDMIIEPSCDTKIEATWLAVVEFIKWYNNQNIT